MHNFQLSFQRPFRNATPLSCFIPWICDATLWYFCEHAPTYFCGDPNHVRARGTNFRENGDGYFRDEDTVNTSERRDVARFEFFNVARYSLVTRSPFSTQRGPGTDIVPLGKNFWRIMNISKRGNFIASTNHEFEANVTHRYYKINDRQMAWM